MLLQMALFCSFLWLRSILLCIYVPCLFDAFICQWTSGWFPCVDWWEWGCSEHRGAWIFLNAGFVRRIAGAYGSSECSFLRPRRTACPSLHSHQQGRRLLFSPHIPQHSLFEDLLMMAILFLKCFLIIVGLQCWVNFCCTAKWPSRRWLFWLVWGGRGSVFLNQEWDGVFFLWSHSLFLFLFLFSFGGGHTRGMLQCLVQGWNGSHRSDCAESLACCGTREFHCLKTSD